jgi:hypothetical protein
MQNGDRRHALLCSEAAGAPGRRIPTSVHHLCVVSLRRPASAPISHWLASRSFGQCSAHVHSSAQDFFLNFSPFKNHILEIVSPKFYFQTLFYHIYVVA